MEITWYGHSCFRLTERNYATVVTDPFDNKSIGYDSLRLKSDIVTVSHAAPGHNNTDAVKGVSHVIDGPGEFEIGGVFITGVQSDSGSSGKKKKNTDSTPRNTIYVFDYDGITVAHLGDLNVTPTQSEIESLGTVNVVLVPVGGGGGLNAAKAAEVISLIEPSLVIPMHYSTPATTVSLDTLNKFIKEMGLSQPDAQPSLKVSRSSLPNETHVVVLDFQKS
jgi:L-ascorbate metabolism protein UlaG (beta-lactamase superfamily)